MGIVLHPPSGKPALSAQQFVERLKRAGIQVKLNQASAKRAIIEQILFAYQKWIDAEEFDPAEFDDLVADYGRAVCITILHPDIDEDDPLGLMFTGGEQLWFGECYPTDTDAKSRAIMQFASIIGYEAEGE